MANDDLKKPLLMPNDDPESGYVLKEAQCLAERGTDCVKQLASICVVPSVLRELSTKSFKPRMVSIGPLHQEDNDRLELEGLKKTYLHDLLTRSSLPSEQIITRCLQEVNANIDKIKSNYPAKIKTKYSDPERDAQLAKMMVLDGSFILEFCLKQDNEKINDLSDLQITCIAIDLMLLENQIPFFVLRVIFNITKLPPCRRSNSLTSLLRNVLSKYVHPFNEELHDNYFSVTDGSEDSDHKHVLDCLHKIYQFSPSNGERDHTTLNYNHSVVELDRSGVNFKPLEENKCRLAMNFKSSTFAGFSCPWGKPTLVMPKLIIEDFTELLLRNFIAYEQSFPNDNYYFTSYASAMDILIDNQEDVGKLVESKVIVNNLGSNEEAAKLINGICKNIYMDSKLFSYTKEMRQLDDYKKSRWPRNLAHLKRTYFNNPWNAIALFAGIILFVITVVQFGLSIITI